MGSLKRVRTRLAGTSIILTLVLPFSAARMHASNLPLTNASCDYSSNISFAGCSAAAQPIGDSGVQLYLTTPDAYLYTFVVEIGEVESSYDLAAWGPADLAWTPAAVPVDWSISFTANSWVDSWTLDLTLSGYLNGSVQVGSTHPSLDWVQTSGSTAIPITVNAADTDQTISAIFTALWEYNVEGEGAVPVNYPAYLSPPDTYFDFDPAPEPVTWAVIGCGLVALYVGERASRLR